MGVVYTRGFVRRVLYTGAFVQRVSSVVILSTMGFVRGSLSVMGIIAWWFCPPGFFVHGDFVY